MNSPRFWLGVALVLIGGVWFGQGMGWIGGSAMSGVALWAIVGPVSRWSGSRSPCRPSARSADPHTSRATLIRWTANCRTSSSRSSCATSWPPSTRIGRTTRSTRVPWLST